MTAAAGEAPLDPVDRLGVYILPGRVSDPRAGIAEARAAEEIGFGSIWIAEQWDAKELGVLAGAVSQVTERVRIVAGTSHFATRHPIVLAGLASTLNALSNGRFVLGVSRGGAAAGPVLRDLDGRANTTAAIRDHAAILRRIWDGERFSSSGPAGEFATLGNTNAPAGLGSPLLLAAIGENSLRLAGECFDGVVLAPFVTPGGVRRSTEIVRNAAVEAGRDPLDVRIYTLVVAVSPRLSADEQAAVLARQAVFYFHAPPVTRLIAAANGWEEQAFEALWSHPLLASAGLGGAGLTPEQIIEISRVIPEEYLADGTSIGDAEQTAAGLVPFLDAGADEVVLFGPTAHDCRDVVASYREPAAANVGHGGGSHS